MAIQRWNPFQSLVDMHRSLDSLFGDWHPAGLEDFVVDGYKVPLDVYQTPDSLVIKASLPGVKSDDVQVSITNNTLSIKAEVKGEEETRDEDYIIKERRIGSYSRTVSLPSGLNSDKAEATFENGVLTLEIPKAEEARAKEVKIKVKNS